MLISVVIPTCNRNDLLSKCLDLLAPTYQSVTDQYQLIVTDDSKTNGAKELVEKNYSWAKWIPGPKRGPAANRNNGARNAIGDWIVFIDDDCLPDKDILKYYQEAILSSTSVSAFEGAIFPDDWEKLKIDMSECPVNTNGGLFWSANICVKRTVFERIAGFDENFLLAAQEDQDFHERMLKETEIEFVKAAFLVHPVRIILLSKKLKQIPIATRNWFIYEKKHNQQSWARVRGMFFKFVVDFTKSTLRNLLKGKLKNAILDLGFLFVGVPVYLKTAITNLNNQ